MKTKFLYSSILLITAMGLFLGFKISDNIYGSKSNNNSQVENYQPQHDYQTDNVAVYSDDFDGDNTVVGITARGYKAYNLSTVIGLTASWFQGNPTVFTAFNGPSSGYIASNFQATTLTNNIDVWLITPKIPGGIVVGDSLIFWARSTDAGINYPDSMRVFYAPTGDSLTNGTYTELGRFKFVNPAIGAANNGYERKAYRLPVAAPNGRILLKYSVVNGGPNGSNSDFIGIDALKIERAAAPPPVLPTTWYEQTSGLTTQLTSVSAPDIQNVWVSGYAGKVIRTTNGGTWASASGNLGTADIYTIYAFDANNALVTTSPGGGGSGSFVYRTSNGGTNWNQVYTDPSASAFIDSWYFKDANNGLMFADGYGGRSKIYKTTNAGNTWDTTGVNFASTDGSYNNASFGIGDVVYFGTATSKFYKTTNFGASWAPVTATGNTNTFSFWFNDVNNGLIGGTIMQSTTNGGTTLTTSTVAGSGSFSGTVGTTAGNYWTARGTTVYGTTNQGTAWTVAHVGNGGTFNHMTVARTGSPHLYAVTSTGGISKFGGPFTGITPVTSVADKYSLSQNYPNPFNPTTNIKFAMPVSGVVSLKIYNMLGKEVATLVNGNLSSGSYSYDFNASNLASGVYFYKLETAEFSDVKKMMLVK